MKGWLVDTNILSEIRRPNGSAAVKQWVAARATTSLFVSVVTLAEIRWGIDRVSDLEKQQALSDWLSGVLRPWFGERALPVDEDVLVAWRHLNAASRQSGHTLDQADALIAATAVVHDLVVVTRNTRDFAPMGVRLFNPFELPA